MSKETWKPIAGLSSTGEVSSKGRYRDLPNKTKATYGNYRDGYLYFNIIIYSKGKQSKRSFIAHRLVCMAFLDNPMKKPCVNHINGVKCDNRIENLEWLTYSENTMHSIKKLDPKRDVLHRKEIKRLMHIFSKKPIYGFRHRIAKERLSYEDNNYPGFSKWVIDTYGIRYDNLFSYACNCGYLIHVLSTQYRIATELNADITFHPNNKVTITPTNK